MNQGAEYTDGSESGPRSMDRKRINKLTRGALGLTCIFVILLLFSAAIGLFFGTHGYSLSNFNIYAQVGDVVLVYNRAFCQGLTAEFDSDRDVPYDNNAHATTLYLLSGSPPLTDRKHLNISRKDMSLSNLPYSWNFQMNKGSNASFQFCYQSNDSSTYNVDFYLIKGGNNQLDWWLNPSNSKLALKVVLLRSKCQTIPYKVQHDDTYYFALYTTSVDNSKKFDILFEADLSIYHISKDMIIQNCSFFSNIYSSCSVTIPISSSSTAVLSLRTPYPYYYTDDRDVWITCQPRIWFYVVVGLCCFLAIMFITVVPFVAFNIYMKKKFLNESVPYSRVKEEDSNLLNAVNDADADEPNYPA